MKIFLISPVTNIRSIEEDVTQVAKYVKMLEDNGHNVHWPLRDTDQNDPIGYRICCDNLRAIENADEVHVWWNPETRGGLFDLGAAVALGKTIRLANSVQETTGKSFENVIIELDLRNKE